MMAGTRKSFCIVCMANYCRSPVVEYILKNKFGNKYEFLSAGIAPISLPSMDPRSLNFLKENNFSYDLHTPKKINNKILNYFDKILAVDFYVLNQLNVSYPKHKHKFISLTRGFSDINIIDPYKFQVDAYNKTMNDIKYVSEKINLEEL